MPPNSIDVKNGTVRGGLIPKVSEMKCQKSVNATKTGFHEKDSAAPYIKNIQSQPRMIRLFTDKVHFVGHLHWSRK